MHANAIPESTTSHRAEPTLVALKKVQVQGTKIWRVVRRKVVVYVVNHFFC